MVVREVRGREVAATGTDAMFGLIGDANLFMVNSFTERQHGTYVSAVHEASAVMMAHGYACRAGRLGVATVTQGPGLTNTATALTEAVRSGTPLLLITGDTAPNNKLNQQTLQQEPFVRSGGGWGGRWAPRQARATSRARPRDGWAAAGRCQRSRLCWRSGRATASSPPGRASTRGPRSGTHSSRARTWFTSTPTRRGSGPKCR